MIFHYLSLSYGIPHYLFTIFPCLTESLNIFSLSFPIFRYPSLSFHYIPLSFAIPYYLLTIFPYLLLSLTICPYPSLYFHYLFTISPYLLLSVNIFSLSFPIFCYPSLSFPIFCYPSLSFGYLSLSF